LSPENDDRTPSPNDQIDCNLLVSRITLSANHLSTTPYVRETYRPVDQDPNAKLIRQSIIVNSTAWQPRHGGVETSNPVIHVHLRFPPRATTTVLHRFNGIQYPVPLRTTLVTICPRFIRVCNLVSNE
jgi:hypothetical protein